MLNSFKKNILILLFLPLLASCAQPVEIYKDINTPAAAGEFEKAVNIHEEKSKTIYNKNDIILSNLNSGMLNHYASHYEESNKKLSEAETLIFKSYGFSISDAVASSVINDNMNEYTGEDYEDIYINVFKALNFIALDENEKAMVEIRRINRKLSDLRLKYRNEFEKARKDFNSLNVDLSGVDTSKAIAKLEFTDSAFARYISLLLYRADRDIDAANLDFKFMREAFNLQKSLYNFKLPSHLEDDINYPKDKARLNIFAFSGFPPVKEAQDMRLFLGELYVKISLPTLINRPSQVKSIEVQAINKETQKVYSQNLEKLESIENIMVDTFNQKLAVIYVKSIVRSISKSLIANEASKQAGSSSLSLLVQLLMSEMTEHADTRMAHYFPANVHTTGITLEEGVYDIAITYKSGNGSKLYTSKKENVNVKKGYALNLVESTYLN